MNDAINTNWHIPNNAILFILPTNIFKSEVILIYIYVQKMNKTLEKD